MATFKRLLAFLVGGAIIGTVIASIIAPGLISWYSTPGAGAPPGFDLSPFARGVVSMLLKSQLAGAGVGALLALVLAFLLRSRSKPSPTPASGPEKAA